MERPDESPDCAPQDRAGTISRRENPDRGCFDRVSGFNGIVQYLRAKRRRMFSKQCESILAPQPPTNPTMVTGDEAQKIITAHPFWYSTIELAPGVFTPGLNIPTVALTRAALRAIPLEGLSCLDVGSVEGVVPVLLARRGAREVVSYDRVDWSSKVNFIKACYGASFRYISGMNYADFQAQAMRLEAHPFDVVVFSGVLYHMFDPLGGLLRTRSLVRDGGLVVVETSALVNETMAMFFNADGWLLPPPNYFVPSLACLDYLLRLSRLVPLDFINLGLGGARLPADHARVCVVCRAVDTPQAFKGGEWDNHLISDYRDYLNWQDTASDEPPVPLRSLGSELVHRNDGTLDLLESVRSAEAYAATPRQTVLYLDDVS
jgi:2-polyprenyl-3-methyl-5-hydroxy-6-metoxy-1,4-benzoquinol methylase